MISFFRLFVSTDGQMLQPGVRVGSLFYGDRMGERLQLWYPFLFNCQPMGVAHFWVCLAVACVSASGQCLWLQHHGEASCRQTLSVAEIQHQEYLTLDAEAERCERLMAAGCCLAQHIHVPLPKHKRPGRDIQSWWCPRNLSPELRRRRLRPDQWPNPNEEAEAVVTFQTQDAPWHLDRIDSRPSIFDNQYLPFAIDGRRGPSDPLLHAYIVDTGIQPSHEQFGGFDVRLDYPSKSGALDCNGHGTHVASLVASRTKGIIYEGGRVALHAVRALDCSGSGTTRTIVEALAWIAANAEYPAVINLSVGGPRSALLNAVIDDLYSNYSLISVVAAGNEDQDACTRSPSSAATSLTVGATNLGDQRALYSNYGRCVSLWAPGSDVIGASAAGPQVYRSRSGTSMAAPQVVGALLRHLAWQSTSVAEARQAVLQRCTTGTINNIGPGSPNRFLFLGVEGGPPSPPPPPSVPLASPRPARPVDAVRPGPMAAPLVSSGQATAFHQVLFHFLAIICIFF